MDQEQPGVECNPVLEQDRVFDTYDHFNRFGVVMFKQNRKIYENIASQLRSHERIIEAGCGNGAGTAIIERGLICKSPGSLVATDKCQRNTDFARELYPWIDFKVWDIEDPWYENRAGAVLCIECLEHVGNPGRALRNLISASLSSVWISTPNGKGKSRPPDNPFHVREYTPYEMLLMIFDAGGFEVDICDWKTLTRLDKYTDVDPLVYRIGV